MEIKLALSFAKTSVNMFKKWQPRRPEKIRDAAKTPEPKEDED